MFMLTAGSDVGIKNCFELLIKPKDEIITVAAGFPTTVAPIIQNGCVPVYLDVELDTVNIDTRNLNTDFIDLTQPTGEMDQ